MRTSTLLAAIGAICVPMLSADLAQAQASRTWVSGVGDDANPCSRTAPCKTFPGAISKTATNGVINCIDPGGFGAVTIGKSITIDCAGTFGGIAAAGTQGIIVNGAGAVVHIRNIAIEGFGTGTNGINIIQAATVHIENVFIDGFRTGAATGIRIAPSAATEVNVTNSTIADNGSSTNIGGGIVVAPTGAAGTATVSLNKVYVRNNSVGVLADASATTNASGVRVLLSESEVGGNAGHGVRVFSASTASLIFANSSNISNNVGTGFIAEGTGASGISGATTITRNGAGVSGPINTLGNNQLINNSGNNGTFSAPVIPLQ